MATFGSVVDGNTAASIFDAIRGSEATCPETGIADSIDLRLSDIAVDMPCLVRGALYKVSDKSFVGETEERDLEGQAAGVYTFNFAEPKPSVENIKYVIVGWASSFCEMRCISDGACIRHLDSESYDGFPNPLVSSTAAYRYCGSCDYTPSGNGANIPAIMRHYRNLRTNITLPKPNLRFPKLKVRRI